MSTATVRIYLLGQFAVERGGELVPSAAWKRRRPVELLAHLALASGRVLHREEVIDRLWPDKDLDAGANNLYRAIHDLRRIVGDEAVTFERGIVGLANDVWIDVEDFEAGVARGDNASIEEAIALYRGELLPDDPYSNDLAARREALRQRFVDAGLRLAESLTDSADPEKQISILRRVLEIDPTIQKAHRYMMSALARSGRRADALRQFKECVKALRAHLDTEPSRETVALHDSIRSADDEPTAAQPEDPEAWSHVAHRLIGSDRPPPLRGRGEAVDRARSFAEEGTGVLLIIGEAGVGKTRLAVETVRIVAAAGARLLVGVGVDFEGTAPYTPFVDAWSDYLRRNGLPLDDNPFASFEPTPGASAQEDRLRLFQTVERSLGQMTGSSPTCLVIEDAHLADESSLQLVHHLARAAKHLGLMLVLTMREEEVRLGLPLHRLLAGLAREHLETRIEIARLGRGGTRQLISDLRGQEPDDAMVESIYRLTEGNPFYTEEVVRAMGEHESDEVALPGDVLATVRQRVSRLGRDAERLLLAASVVGQRFDFDLVCRAANIEVEQALEALESCIESRFLEEDRGEYRFRHALMREALYSGLTHARRVYLHRGVADTIETVAGGEESAEVLAFHHQSAGQVDRALPYLLAAANRAKSRLGYGEAIQFFEQALDLMNALGHEPDDQRLEILLSLGAMRVALGALEDAVANLHTAIDLKSNTTGWRPTALQRAGAHRLCVFAAIEGGQLETAERTLDDALALLEAEAPGPEKSAEVGSLLYLYSQLRWHQNRHSEAYDFAEQCLAEAEIVDDPEAVARGYEMLALACHSLGEWSKGTEFEERRQNLADGGLDVAGAFDAHL